MEELFLGALLAGEELDVVDEEQVDGAIALPELRGLVVPDGRDQVVGELLAREVLDPEVGVALGEAVADSLEQMRLAEAHASVDEQGVVRLGRRVGDRQAGRLGELV